MILGKEVLVLIGLFLTTLFTPSCGTEIPEGIKPEKYNMEQLDPNLPCLKSVMGSLFQGEQDFFLNIYSMFSLIREQEEDPSKEKKIDPKYYKMNQDTISIFVMLQKRKGLLTRNEDVNWGNVLEEIKDSLVFLTPEDYLTIEKQGSLKSIPYIWLPQCNVKIYVPQDFFLRNAHELTIGFFQTLDDYFKWILNGIASTPGYVQNLFFGYDKEGNFVIIDGNKLSSGEFNELRKRLQQKQEPPK